MASVAVIPISASVVPDALPQALRRASAGQVGELDRAALRRSLAAVPAAGMAGAFAEVRADRQSWSGGAGIADLSIARPAGPAMRQRVGSITKTFVATALLQLVDEGRLGLDDPVARWLPDLLPAEISRETTVRMLLNHTSGIGNYTDTLLDSLAAVERMRTTTYTPRELVAIAVEMPRTGAPGESYSYSNTNYILVGLILQRVTGNDPAAEVTRRIIRPLRLTDTYFPGANPRIREPHAGAYFNPLGVKDFSEYRMTWAWMAGELIAPMGDLNVFFRALLEGRLLSPATMDEMLTTVPFDPEEPEFGGYGLGIYQVPSPCGPLWGHDGGVVGQITVSMHSRDAARQVSLATNVSHYQFLTDEPHPIDIAWWGFLMGAHCPSSAEAAGRFAGSWPMPGVTADAGSIAISTD
jgi:D-alanyl-D-alanine carboxypeptidase